MQQIVFIVIWLLLGWLVMSMAEKRGRNKLLGFCVGFFLGIFGVIIYAIIGDSNEVKQQKHNELVNEIKSEIKSGE